MTHDAIPDPNGTAPAPGRAPGDESNETPSFSADGRYIIFDRFSGYVNTASLFRLRPLCARPGARRDDTSDLGTGVPAA